MYFVSRKLVKNIMYNKIKEKIQDIKNDINKNMIVTINVFLCSKVQRKKKYIVYEIQISQDLQLKIVNMLIEQLDKCLYTEYCRYNLEGKLDGYIEYIENNYVKSIQELETAMIYDNICKSEPDMSKIDFYCIEFRNYNIKCIRQFPKLKQIRKGFIMELFNDQYRKFEGNFLAMDSKIDLIISEEYVYIYNRLSLERILYYREQLEDMCIKVLDDMEKSNCINNFKKLRKECMADKNLVKAVAGIKLSGRLYEFIEVLKNNSDKVKKVIDDVGGGIVINNNIIEYNNKDDLRFIVKLINDSYFKSLILNRTGYAKLEGVLNDG